MRILVDADACPGKDIIEDVAAQHNIEVIMYCDVNHILSSSYSVIKYVDSGFQSVDMFLINELDKGDIVISQDYGVASMALGKKAYALNPRGYIYDNKNIDRLLFERHIAFKVRRKGGKTQNHKKRSREDDERLKRGLNRLINIGKTL